MEDEFHDSKICVATGCPFQVEVSLRKAYLENLDVSQDILHRKLENSILHVSVRH